MICRVGGRVSQRSEMWCDATVCDCIREEREQKVECKIWIKTVVNESRG